MKQNPTQFQAIFFLLPATLLTISAARSYETPETERAQLVSRATSCLESGDLRNAEQILLHLTKLSPKHLNEEASAELANAWGSLHLKLGRFGEASVELRSALDQIAPNSPIRPYLLHNLAAAEMQTGRYRAALLHQTEAISLWKHLPAPEDLTLIKSYASLATAQYLTRDRAAAHASLQIAIAATHEKFGAQSQLLADLLATDAAILQSLRHRNSFVRRELFAGLK